MCSARCDGGSRTRTRICLNGEVGEEGCDGQAASLESCNTQVCALCNCPH